MYTTGVKGNTEKKVPVPLILVQPLRGGLRSESTTGTVRHVTLRSLWSVLGLHSVLIPKVSKGGLLPIKGSQIVVRSRHLDGGS